MVFVINNLKEEGVRMKIAYLGMGNMGVRMAPNLYKAGFGISVWARYQGNSWCNVEKLAQQGIKGCQTIEEAVKGARIIGTCVTNDQAVIEVVTAALPCLEPGTILLDHSTIAPETARHLAEKYKEKDCSFLDCPFSGGESGAEAGTLTVMVGGDRKSFEFCKEYFDAISRYAIYMGESGCGSITKLLNQHMAGINQAVVCEAIIMAKRANIDLESLYTIINNSWGRSFAFERIVIERLLHDDFYPTYAPSEMMNKDLHHVLELAESLSYNAKFAHLASEYFQKNVDEGRGKWDHSSIIKCME